MAGIYQNLREEIELLEIELKDLKVEHKYLIKNMHMNAPKFNGVTDYSKERVTGGQVPLTLDEIAGRHDRIMEKAVCLKEEITEKRTLMEEAKHAVQGMKGIEKQIMYLRDVQGLNLRQIAGVLDYSYDHIRRISSQMKRCHSYATIVPHCS